MIVDGALQLQTFGLSHILMPQAPAASAWPSSSRLLVGEPSPSQAVQAVCAHFYAVTFIPHSATCRLPCADKRFVSVSCGVEVYRFEPFTGFNAGGG